MVFDECIDGDYRIYAGALEAPRGQGYIAAVVVNRVRGETAPREAFRDESLAGGHRWPSAGEALRYALQYTRALIRNANPLLRC